MCFVVVLMLCNQILCLSKTKINFRVYFISNYAPLHYHITTMCQVRLDKMNNSALENIV